jgi:hypothetical protein
MVKINSSKTTALDLINKMAIEVEKKMPSQKEMLNDIKMMNFKIHPVSGDIFSITKKEIGFIESLWKLGKIEEMMTDKIELLDDEEKDVLYSYLDEMQIKTQNNIADNIQRLSKKDQRQLKILEFEIFKDRFVDKSKLN